MLTQIKINYKEYPEFMFAMIASYLPSNEGGEIRRLAGNVIFRHEDTKGNTYKNGLLHSYDDQPAEITKTLKLWYSNGKLHRKEKPAICYTNGNCKYYKKNRLHSYNDSHLNM